MTATVISLASERELREQLELTKTMSIIRSAACCYLKQILDDLEAEPVPRVEVIAEHRAAYELACNWNATVAALAVKGRK